MKQALVSILLFVLLFPAEAQEGQANGALKLTSADGRTIEVFVLEVGEDAAKVKRADGKEFDIPFGKLSVESVEALRNLQSKPSKPGGEAVLEVGQRLGREEGGLMSKIFESNFAWAHAVQFGKSEEEVTEKRAELDALLASVEKMHAGLGIKSRCERLLATSRGEESLGPVPSEAQIGAVVCLSSIPGDESVAALFQAIRVRLPEGVEMEGHKALADRCKGKVMDRVVDLLNSDDEHDRADAACILMEIDSREQVAELKARESKVTNPDGKERLKAVYSLIRLED